VASRPSSTSGSTQGDGRAPAVHHVVQFAPRERALAPPANDNLRRPRQRRVALLGCALGFVLLGAALVYFSLG